MKTYLYVLPLKNAHTDFSQFGNDISNLINEDLELLGLELINEGSLENIKDLIEEILKKNIATSIYFKKRVEFTRFVKKVAFYLNSTKCFVAAFRLQSPIKNPDEIFKKYFMANSNFTIPETFMISEGRAENTNELFFDIFEKLMIDLSLVIHYF